MNACSYTPGAWTAVVCERLVALVGPDTPEAAVATLWDVAAAGGGVVDALLELADVPLPTFALVTLSQTGLLHAALRGPVEVVTGAGAPRPLRADEDVPWTEVTAHDVPAVTLGAVDGAAAAGPPLPLVAGVVRAAQVRATADLWGAPSGAPARAAVVDDDHEGLTIVTGDLTRLRASVPAAPARPPVAAPAPARPARIVLSTGLVVPLDRTVLLGRAPQVGRVAARELPRLVTVPSPHHDISRTHAQVRQEGEHVLVTDLDSLNGVQVSRAELPGVPARRVHPGEPTVVGPGDVVDLGDGVTFAVEVDG